ncbi:inositol monophosphatase [Helcobacillus massiliensis]|uniref:inositol monophosphatase family protein n=1 Tax=Helcobacillus massiliensis TaxID=521392 RepID=UPI0021A5DA08|nr:inositol monophosphatase family protein [Helcobacillus massiliensis]MCT1558755.1 inositol monophosphatase [Helcobacillus massiliensis]MCT2037521.1 inositol monophosphatase [Helcobacillus massiliensis]
MTSASAPTITSLVDAARAAASAAADYQRGLDRSAIDREYKLNAHDIVTEHDKRSEQIIVDALSAAVPDARILGEESGHQGGDGPVAFIVDPIDGTSNFAAGLPLFCVSIGIEIDGALVGGVINAPILHQEFFSDDTGAYLNGERLGPHTMKPQQDALVLSSFPGNRDFSDHPDIALDLAGALRSDTSALRSLGTAALELAYVAAGWADAAMLLSIKPWDVAAGFHLVEQAGGSVRAWSGEPGVESDGGMTPLHMRPAYVACAGQDRLPTLDLIAERVHSHRAGASPN